MSEQNDQVKQSLNISLPVDVAKHLDSMSKKLNTSKKDIALLALRQYIAIKNRELFYQEKYPESSIESEVKFKVFDDTRPKEMTAVMIY